MKPVFKIIIVLIIFSATACEKDYYGVKPIPPGPVSFTTQVLPILTTSCAISGCHVPGAQTPDLTAANAYNDLTGLGYATPDDSLAPQNSVLYKHLSGNLKIMPPSGS